MVSLSRLVANLRGEDVVSHVPHRLPPAYVGVAHSLHFGEHRAHSCVCGLVTFLINEDPPVKETYDSSIIVSTTFLRNPTVQPPKRKVI